MYNRLLHALSASLLLRFGSLFRPPKPRYYTSGMAGLGLHAPWFRYPISPLILAESYLLFPQVSDILFIFASVFVSPLCEISQLRYLNDLTCSIGYLFIAILLQISLGPLNVMAFVSLIDIFIQYFIAICSKLCIARCKLSAEYSNKPAITILSSARRYCTFYALIF